jgi:hypothetical protein
MVPVTHADILRRLRRCDSRESRLDAIAEMILAVSEHPEMQDKIILLDHLAAQAERTAKRYSYVALSKDRRPCPRVTRRHHTVGLDFADLYPGALGKVWALPVLTQEFVEDHRYVWRRR